MYGASGILANKLIVQARFTREAMSYRLLIREN
jgi:hypothetical protein